MREHVRLPPPTRALLLAGLLAGLALVVGGLTALDQRTFSGDRWSQHRDGAGEIVLPEARRRPAPPVRYGRDDAEPARSSRPVRAEVDPGAAAPTVRDGVPAAVGENQAPERERRAGAPARPDADTDADGLPDRWETRHGLDARRANAHGDPDGDGLWNVTELELRTDPREIDSDHDGRSDGDSDPDADGVPNVVEQRIAALDPLVRDTDRDGRHDGEDDTDGDGLPNATEVQLRLDPADEDTAGNGVADGAEDSDGDGVTNADELQTGTDPGTPDAPDTPVAPPEEPEPEPIGPPELPSEPAPAAPADGGATPPATELAPTDPAPVETVPVEPAPAAPAPVEPAAPAPVEPAA
jgi:hypothetical protein